MKKLLPFYICSVLAVLVIGVSSARPAEWQWSVPVKNEKPENGPARAWLWIPPQCDRIRGVVVAQHNMEEVSILENPKFRAALAELNFAEIWVAPPFDHLFRFNAGAGETFDDLVSRLADESGYTELKFAPVAPLGHSAAASWPYYFAAWNPDRTLCALSVSGQWPYYRDPKWAPDIWGDRNIDFVPALESMGEYESADTWSSEGLRERQQHPLLPLSMLANPGQGHFASTDAKAEYLALYLKKAAQYRLPKNWDATSPPKLIPIDPTKTGWLADKWRRDQPPAAPAAPVGKYQGNPNEAFWFFDGDLAKATEQYEAAYRGLKPQLAGYMQGGNGYHPLPPQPTNLKSVRGEPQGGEGQMSLVPQTDTHLQITLDFEPDEYHPLPPSGYPPHPIYQAGEGSEGGRGSNPSDGATFKLAAAFYDAVPPGSPRLPGWTELPVGSPLGHSKVGAISIDPICGPVEKLSADTFAVRFQKETLLSTNARNYELVFAAVHPGDGEYKPAVQQAHMFIPARNTNGAEQHIIFPEIPDQKASVKSLKLYATSDAGVPVNYFVLEGPAEVDGNILKLTALPPRAKFPVRVTVVAWQYGRAGEPKLQSAAPVTRSLDLVK